MGLFGKKKDKGPEKPELTTTVIGPYKLFKKGWQVDAAELAASMTDHWALQGPWAEDYGPVADKEKLMELMDMSLEMDFVDDCYLVDTRTGSLGSVVVWDWDEEEVDMPQYFHEEDIQWIGLSDRKAGPATCPGCGAPVEPGDVFCGSCGRKLK